MSPTIPASFHRMLREGLLLLAMAGTAFSGQAGTALSGQAGKALSGQAGKALSGQSGTAASSPAAEAPLNLTLPAKPSELLTAPDATWRPLLDALDADLAARERLGASLGRAAQIALHIERAVLAQTRHAWPQAIAAIDAARAQQESESGRQTAGLLNEMLARQALAGGDGAWLRRAVRERVLAMPWTEVGPAILSIRQQLAGMEAANVHDYAVRHWDLSTQFSKGRADSTFALQLLGARFQLQQVLPQRAALLLGLDDAIAQRTVQPSS